MPDALGVRPGAMHAVVRHSGGAGPTLVYVPGIDGTGHFLFGLAERLEREFHLIRLRYEAPEPAPEGGDTYEELARTISSAIRAEVDGPVLLLAESFGGAVALSTALEDPELVAGLAIVNSFAHFHKRFGLALTRLFGPIVPHRLMQVGRRVLAQRSFFGKRRDPEALRAFLATPDFVLDQGYRRRLAMIKELNLLPKLDGIEVPVDLFASDRDEVVRSPLEAKRMADALPNSRVEILPGAGHIALPLAEEPWVERLIDLAVRAGVRER